MALKYQIDTLDGLPATTAALYTPKGGKFVLDAEGFPTGDDNLAEIRGALERERSDRKSAREELAALREAAAAAAEEKLRKEGDFKSLLKTSEERLALLTKQVETERAARANGEVSREAMRIAADIADGPNARILSKFITERLRFEDGSIKVTDQSGALTGITLDQLRDEFRASSDFKALVTASRAAGGGAAGAGSGGAASKSITRSTFDQMGVAQKSEFARTGGTITD